MGVSEAGGLIDEWAAGMGIRKWCRHERPEHDSAVVRVPENR